MPPSFVGRRARVLTSFFFCLVILALTGCSGINASKSISPLDFLIPGGGGFLHPMNNPQPLPVPAATNSTVVVAQLR
jgi:hypothetical protein